MLYFDSGIWIKFVVVNLNEMYHSVAAGKGVGPLLFNYSGVSRNCLLSIWIYYRIPKFYRLYTAIFYKKSALKQSRSSKYLEN
mgnify:CR=1 FL=1